MLRLHSFVSRLVGLSVVFSFTAHASEAGAAPKAAARSIWIDVRPRTCASEAVTFAREVALACDALGDECRIAESEVEATHRAVLVCESPTTWTLKAEAADGRALYTVTLDGDREERHRKAAMWVARIGNDGPTETNTTAQTPPAPLSIASGDVQIAEKDKEGPRRPKEAWGGIALDGQIGVTNSNQGTSFRGIHGAIMYDVGALRVGLAGSFLQLFAAGHNATYGGDKAADLKTVAVRAGVGAPFTDSIVGLWIEGGVSWAHLDEVSLYHATTELDFVGPSGRAEVDLQLPFKSPVRPYLYAAGTHTFNEFGEGVQSALVGAGLAWRAW